MSGGTALEPASPLPLPLPLPSALRPAGTAGRSGERPRRPVDAPAIGFVWRRATGPPPGDALSSLSPVRESQPVTCPPSPSRCATRWPLAQVTIHTTRRPPARASLRPRALRRERSPLRCERAPSDPTRRAAINCVMLPANVHALTRKYCPTCAPERSSRQRSSSYTSSHSRQPLRAGRIPHA